MDQRLLTKSRFFMIPIITSSSSVSTRSEGWATPPLRPLGRPYVSLAGSRGVSAKPCRRALEQIPYTGPDRRYTSLKLLLHHLESLSPTQSLLCTKHKPKLNVHFASRKCTSDAAVTPDQSLAGPGSSFVPRAPDGTNPAIQFKSQLSPRNVG